MDENLKFYLELEGLKKYDALLKKHIPIFVTPDKVEIMKSIKPELGQLVIFTNFERKKSDNTTITSAGIKVGEGNEENKKTIEQLPFIDWFYWDHIDDADIHVTAEQKKFWNKKISCKVDDETLNLFMDDETLNLFKNEKE